MHTLERIIIHVLRSLEPYSLQFTFIACLHDNIFSKHGTRLPFSLQHDHEMREGMKTKRQ